MGCGGSKLESDDDTAPPGLRPFRRRIDEIRQRRSGRTVSKDDALSSKQLLNNEGEDGHHHHYLPDDPDQIQKNVSSQPPENERSDKGSSTYEKEQSNNDHHHPMDAPDSEMRMTVSSPSQNEIVGSGMRQSTPENDQNNNNNNNKNVESDKPDTDVVSPGKEKDREGEDKWHEGDRKEDNSSGSDDEKEIDGYGEGGEIGPGSPSLRREGGNIYEDGRQIGPGSPSFREYFNSSSSNVANKDSADAGNGEDRSSGVKMEDKLSQRKESSSCSSEASVDKFVKKENKGRIFKNVLPKGKQGGVKNLWNVGSCYHPSSASVHRKVDA
ncbi:cGMP-specific 3',5'-cGMP phosphodiesterase 3-like [Telopea speciosissima]|uniref:cGMP-specific 3',5'-cGMP phosphodiesterase 3-like n=1 Tax=Telopea speciosissima TaxID=54955 RepID=UPI001CC43102|nr:cGMP-specific 3',5'-cGMP phosphodiesterase 3-like [Telopea speciosissima]